MARESGGPEKRGHSRACSSSRVLCGDPRVCTSEPWVPDSRLHQQYAKGADMPRAQIKDEKTYQALRREGNSEEKSARIANAAAGSSRKTVGKRGGKGGSSADWRKKDLVDR